VNHCYCNQPYDKTKFYVGCDICGRWFHGKCIGISEKKSKKISTWLCDNCKGEAETAEKELFCLCRTPYDDTKFYVGCDGCEGWYHPACVGITRQDAELMAEYVCPKCSGTQNATETGSEDDAASSSRISVPSLNRSDYPFLWRVLESLMEHRASWPFRQPVDAEKHPDYYRLIKNPMDLSTVQRRLEDLEYQRLSDFTSDVCRIFENSRVYNPKDSPIVQCADILEKRFRENLVEARNQADNLGGAAGKATEGQMDSFDEEQSERMMPFEEEDGTMEEETNLFEDDF